MIQDWFGYPNETALRGSSSKSKLKISFTDLPLQVLRNDRASYSVLHVRCEKAVSGCHSFRHPARKRFQRRSPAVK